MSRLTCTMVLAAIAVILPASVAAQGTDPSNGTWKLNPAKSSGSGPPQSESRKYEISGDNYKMTTDGISAEGKPFHYEITAKIDGKDYPTPGLPSGLDMISMTRVDAYTTNAVQKKGGKPDTYVTRTVAKDGKSMTIQFRRLGEKGEKMERLQFYDKQ